MSVTDDAAPRAVATPPRAESAGVLHPQVAWTSFDRYGRYAAIAAAVRRNLGPGAHQVLDVGDGSGWLTAFDGGLRVANVDVQIDPTRFDTAISVRGDGSRLPVRTGSVPCVVTSDALEHVPADNRGAFIAELGRTSSDLLVVAAPFDTAGVAGVEEFVARYFDATSGQPQPQLVEHRANGLPSLEQTVGDIEAEGFAVASFGNGNLHDWLLVMLLKFQLLARPGLEFVDLASDILYNFLLTARNDRPPFYRHVLVARRGTEPLLPEPDAEPAPGASDISALLAGVLAATGAEVNRRDIEVRATRTEEALAVGMDHLQRRFSGIEEALDQILAQVAAVRGEVDSLEHRSELLVHPLRSIRRRARRGSTGA